MDKEPHQDIDIYCHGVGYVFIPEPEEVEEIFQGAFTREERKYKTENGITPKCYTVSD